MLEDAALIGHAMQLAYLGKTTGTQAPPVFQAWISDRDLIKQNVPTTDVRVLLTKAQLSDLSDVLKQILDAANEGMISPSDMFARLRSVAATMGADPNQLKQGATTRVADLGVLGEYLQDLPYQSEVLNGRRNLERLGRPGPGKIHPQPEHQTAPLPTLQRRRGPLGGPGARRRQSRQRLPGATGNDALTHHARNQGTERGPWRRTTIAPGTLDELHLRPGEVRAITGESGCGKSTLLEAIGLLLKPERLTHYRLGPQREDVARLLAEDREPALAALRSRALGFVLQNGGLLPFLSVRENILLPRRLLGLAAHSAAVDKAIAALRLEPLLGKLPQALSIGERQRVACVRAIAHEPRVLLADEPTAALDPHNAQRLFELLLNRWPSWVSPPWWYPTTGHWSSASASSAWARSTARGDAL